MPDFTLSEYAAWIALAVSVSKVAWDIFAWRRRRPRLRIRLKRNVYFTDDASNTSAPMDPVSGQRSLTLYLTAVIVNVGEIPTTVDKAYVSNLPGKRWWCGARKLKLIEAGYGYPALDNFDGKKLPLLLKAGEALQLRVAQRALDANPHLKMHYFHVSTLDRDADWVASIPMPTGD